MNTDVESVKGEAAGSTFRFLLYNIRYCTGIGARFHLPVPYAGYFKRSGENLEKIISFIREVDPDIIGLIEVDCGSFRSEKLCQAEVIARQLGHFHVVQNKYGEDSVATRVPVLSKQANALLTRLPISSHRFHYFDKGVKRLVIEAQIEPATVFLVHLSLTYRVRQAQLQNLYRLVREVQGPVIVAGDFNVLWGDQELELFLAATGLTSANGLGTPSHPSKAPKRQLDFILHSEEFKVSGFQAPLVTYSDHVPLVCDLELR
ncbi:endonuclease [Desulfolithobacter dissulfuricans]|uniref:Endonuclease n=1 Tax=Desulfolithobacter dissulfuricans TaxID=2795293 RepID=A0A915TY25_9BACT|nr:endonuclease [Desulfolithobacter dissulfuricans]